MLRFKKRIISIILPIFILCSNTFPVLAHEQSEPNTNCNHNAQVLVDGTYYTLDEYLEKLNTQIVPQNKHEFKSPSIQPYLFDGCSNVFGHDWEWGYWKAGAVSHAPICRRGFVGDYVYTGCQQTITRTATCNRTHCDATTSESDVLIIWCNK